MVTKETLMKLSPYKKYPCTSIFGEKLRFTMEEKGTVFVYAKGKRRRGWRYEPEDFLRKYSVSETSFTEKDPTPAWHRRMRRAVKCMEKSGMWPEIKEVFENILASGMTWDERKYLSTLRHDGSKWTGELRFVDGKWTVDDADQDMVARYKARFPFSFKNADNGREYIDTRYIYEVSGCHLKAMNFGKAGEWESETTKRLIKEALEKKISYSSGRIRVGYDVSFRYDAEENKAWYSEEYRNCGNGHYYLALDGNTALFCEDD